MFAIVYLFLVAVNANLKQYINEDLRCKLEDMYIEPSNVTFSLAVDPIGKGEYNTQ